VVSASQRSASAVQQPRLNGMTASELDHVKSQYASVELADGREGYASVHSRRDPRTRAAGAPAAALRLSPERMGRVEASRPNQIWQSEWAVQQWVGPTWSA
jgi:hypothetical protein